MGSSGKKKTTFAKLNRERMLRERRLDKQLKKDARKQAAAERREQPDGVVADGDGQPLGSDGDGQPLGPDAEQTALGAVAQSPIDE